MAGWVQVWVFEWSPERGDAVAADLADAFEDWPRVLADLAAGDAGDGSYALLGAPRVGAVDHERSVVQLHDAGWRREVLLNVTTDGDLVDVSFALDRRRARPDTVTLRSTVPLAPGEAALLRPRPDVGLVVTRPE